MTLHETIVAARREGVALAPGRPGRLRHYGRRPSTVLLQALTRHKADLLERVRLDAEIESYFLAREMEPPYTLAAFEESFPGRPRTALLACWLRFYRDAGRLPNDAFVLRPGERVFAPKRLYARLGLDLESEGQRLHAALGRVEALKQRVGNPPHPAHKDIPPSPNVWLATNHVPDHHGAEAGDQRGSAPQNQALQGLRV